MESEKIRFKGVVEQFEINNEKYKIKEKTP